MAEELPWPTPKDAAEAEAAQVLGMMLIQSMRRTLETETFSGCAATAVCEFSDPQGRKWMFMGSHT